MISLLACRLWGQALSGTIVGTVTDSAGAVVPGAKVLLTNAGTNFLRTVDSNANGQYVATSIPTGNYSIAVEMQGFQRSVRSGVELTAADTLTVDFRLTVGDVQQTLEVKAEAPLLQSQTAAVSQLITNAQIVEMPLNGRTFTSLVLLSPGAHAGSAANLNNIALRDARQHQLQRQRLQPAEEQLSDRRHGQSQPVAEHADHGADRGFHPGIPRHDKQLLR